MLLAESRRRLGTLLCLNMMLCDISTCWPLLYLVRPAALLARDLWPFAEWQGHVLQTVALLVRDCHKG